MAESPNSYILALQDKRRAILIGAATLVLTLVALGVVNTLGVKAESFVPLEDLSMTSDVTHADGTQEHFADGNFGSLAKGDHALVHVSIPETTPGMEVYMPLFNAIVNIYLDGELFLQDDYDPDDLASHYGNRIYQVPIRPGGGQRELTLEITANQIISFSELSETGLVQANESWKRILEGRVAVFALFLTLMVVALISSLYFIVQSVKQRKLQIGLPIALFELSLIAWYFGTLHMFHLLFGNVELCAKIEYYALNLVPLPLAVFIGMAVESPRFKKAIHVATAIYFAYYLVATALEVSPAQMSYSTLMTYMHMIAGVIFVLLCVSLFFGAGKRDAGHVYILRYGAIIAVVCGIMELMRYNLVKYTEFDNLFTLNGLSVFAVMIIVSFTIAVVLFLISNTREEFALRVERAQLMKLAYTDLLTGMPNRAGLKREADRLKEQGVREYAILFIDVNRLKFANDSYGHDMGDKLLTCVAGIVDDVFAEHGFCGRWGGDEFVAGITDGTPVDALTAELDEKLDEVNARGEFPFEASVACGMAVSSEGSYLDPEEAVMIADQEMYENKKAVKAREAAEPVEEAAEPVEQP